MRGLLVVDHGSRREESNAGLRDVAGRLARLAPECVVRHAHMELAQPDIAAGFAALAAAGADEIRVLPYFLGPGKHIAEDIPRLVAAAAAAHPAVRWSVAAPLGPDDALAALLLRRAAPPA